MKTIKFLVVGCGSIGKRHLAVIDENPFSELVAICDSNKSECTILSKLYDNVSYYTDYQEMLKESVAHVVVIATPHFLHCDMAIYAANNNFNIIVEKPMALNVNDCNNMNFAAKKNNVDLFVIKQNRFNIPVKMTKEALDKNQLGEIYFIKCDIFWNRNNNYYKDSDWRGDISKEGGALYTQASHFIDLMIWFCGEVDSFSGLLQTKSHSIEIEDIGSVVMNFKSKTIGNINWTTSVYSKNYEGSITIIGENGTIKIGGKYLNKIVYWDVKNNDLPKNIDYSDKPNNYGKYQGSSSNHDKVFDSVIMKLNNKKTDFTDGYEGVKSISLIENIYKEIRDNNYDS